MTGRQYTPGGKENLFSIIITKLHRHANDGTRSKLKSEKTENIVLGLWTYISTSVHFLPLLLCLTFLFFQTPPQKMPKTTFV